MVVGLSADESTVTVKAKGERDKTINVPRYCQRTERQSGQPCTLWAAAPAARYPYLLLVTQRQRYCWLDIHGHVSIIEVAATIRNACNSEDRQSERFGLHRAMCLLPLGGLGAGSVGLLSSLNWTFRWIMILWLLTTTGGV